jgi:uncharacterized Zn finger protein
MWWSYEEAEEAKERLQREIAKRVKRGERFEALVPASGKKHLCTTFWGKAWCSHLETYQEYESRLPRGRSYLRQGNVYNLDIGPGKVNAVVAGSELYDTQVLIEPLKASKWHEMVEKCEGQVGSMLDLLAGKLGDGVMRVLSDAEEGLFPNTREIRFDCSCPDHADMCKHVSAVLYGVGVLLDTKPEMLFTLRGVDQAELLSNASSAAISDLSANAGDLADAEFPCRLEHGPHGLDALAVSLDPGQPALPGPATVAVHDERNVTGDGRGGRGGHSRSTSQRSGQGFDKAEGRDWVRGAHASPAAFVLRSPTLPRRPAGLAAG